MVRLPLLIGARPMYMANRRGPLVPLGLGDWYISSNHKDSQILIERTPIGTNIPVSHPINGIPLLLIGSCYVQVVIDKIGTEPSLDIYAERR